MRLDHLSKLMSSSVTPRQSRSWSLTPLLVATTFDPLLINAFEAIIPPLILRYPTILTFFSVHAISWLVAGTNWLPFEHIRQGILNLSRLPWVVPPESSNSKGRIPSLFAYPKADTAVPFEHTQKLTDVAESRGMDIRREIMKIRSICVLIRNS